MQPKEQVDYAAFEQLDIRIGTVVDVQPFPKARNPSWKVQVDLGELGTRWSSAQITAYTPKQLIGTQVCCVVNFGPRNIAGFQSEVLVLGVTGADGMIILLSPRSPAPDGNSLH
ncbi:tRNA-binding protein [Croceibacterium ferulae]|uniref:tRNA-binding protein n=1 Tax=Croceibacterium ferulae TaxID=1854641 RepID=UPI000EB43D7B|nr:tRNA-binding protein [Croceibacterium ferulae]